MNFRIETDEAYGGFVLGWGQGSRMVIDRYGTILDTYTFGDDDNEFRHSAQRHVRKACAQARMEFHRHQFGTRTSDMRKKFVTRVADVANALEAAE